MRYKQHARVERVERMRMALRRLYSLVSISMRVMMIVLK